jgi:hypothetical protein
MQMVLEATHISGAHAVDLEPLLVGRFEPTHERPKILTERPLGVGSEIVPVQELGDQARNTIGRILHGLFRSLFHEYDSEAAGLDRY